MKLLALCQLSAKSYHIEGESGIWASSSWRRSVELSYLSAPCTWNKLAQTAWTQKNIQPKIELSFRRGILSSSRGHHTCWGLRAGWRIPGPALQLNAAHSLHGVLGVAEPAESPDEANFDGLDPQVEAREQDGGCHITSCQHVRHVLQKALLGERPQIPLTDRIGLRHSLRQELRSLSKIAEHAKMANTGRTQKHRIISRSVCGWKWQLVYFVLKLITWFGVSHTQKICSWLEMRDWRQSTTRYSTMDLPVYLSPVRPNAIKPPAIVLIITNGVPAYMDVR